MISIIEAQQDKNLMDKFLIENQGLIGTAIKHNFPYLYSSPGFEDYCQIGFIGLMKAAKRFNPDFGTEFSTYAVPMIRGEIQRYRRGNNDLLLKVPRSAQGIYYKAQRYLNEGYTIDEVSKLLEVPKEHINKLLNELHLPFRLDEYAYDDMHETHKDFISSSDDTENEIIDKITCAEILQASKESFSETYHKVVVLYSRGKKQQQIADVIGVSQAQVSRILLTIFTKLKAEYDKGGFKIMGNQVISESVLLDECRVHGTNAEATRIIAQKYNLNPKQISNQIMHRHIKEKLQKEFGIITEPRTRVKVTLSRAETTRVPEVPEEIIQSEKPSIPIYRKPVLQSLKSQNVPEIKAYELLDGGLRITTDEGGAIHNTSVEKPSRLNIRHTGNHELKRCIGGL